MLVGCNLKRGCAAWEFRYNAGRIIKDWAAVYPLPKVNKQRM